MIDLEMKDLIIKDLKENINFTARLLAEEKEKYQKLHTNRTQTLRDKFAMAALNGMLADSSPTSRKDFTYKELVILSYKIADVMLEARKLEE